MWEIILAFPLTLAAALIQISVFGRIHLMNGNVDLLMLMVISWCLNSSSKFSWIWVLTAGLIMSFVSAMPFNGYLLIYVFLWLLIGFIRKRVWQIPLMLMLFMTIVGTLAEAVFSIGALYLKGGAVNYVAALERVLVPSLVMNLLLAIPVFGLMRDIGYTLYPEEDEE